MRILLKWSISVSVTLALKKRMLFTGLLPPPDFEGSKTYDDSDDGRKLILLCKTCRLWCYNVEGWYGWWDESIVEYVFFEEVCKLCWSCVWNRRTLSFPFLCGLSLYVLTFIMLCSFFFFVSSVLLSWMRRQHWPKQVTCKSLLLSQPNLIKKPSSTHPSFSFPTIVWYLVFYLVLFLSLFFITYTKKFNNHVLILLLFLFCRLFSVLECFVHYYLGVEYL